MKLDLFTWIPASSAGMTILLFAAQLNAAGVCIVCPPGHVCAAGNGPVLGGAEGQILQRTAIGTQWVNASAIQGVQGAQGPQGAAGAQGEEGPAGSTGPIGPAGPNMTGAQLRAAMCPAPAAGSTLTKSHHMCRGQGASSPGSSVIQGHVILGDECYCRLENLELVGCLSSWARHQVFSSTAECASRCANSCNSFSTWHSNIRWN